MDRPPSRASSSWSCLGLSACLIAALSGPGYAWAQPSAGEVPPKLALMVMLKVLTYDRNLPNRGGGDFVVVIATEPAQEAGRREVEVAIKELRNAALRARPVRFVFASIEPGENLRRQLSDSKAQALLLLRGASPQGVELAARAGVDAQAYLLSLDPALVERTVAVGVANEGGRPKILINLTAARLVNAVFEPAVLKHARILP